MSERWKNYFVKQKAFEGEWLATAVAHWGFHERLYGMIQKYCSPGAKLLDVGCGPGWSDLYLSSLGYKVTGLDNEPVLIELAQKQSEKLGGGVNFVVGDAFDLSKLDKRFDLSFSCGVLEHFDRSVTVELLKEQAKFSNYVLIQIPTKYTKYAGGITDERIYSINELCKIVEAAGMTVVTKFGYGDVCVSKMHVLLRLVMPRFAYRLIQNAGFAFSIAVIGKVN
jgi:SAM-dependent methyltransferase